MLPFYLWEIDYTLRKEATYINANYRLVSLQIFLFIPTIPQKSITAFWQINQDRNCLCSLLRVYPIEELCLSIPNTCILATNSIILRHTEITSCIGKLIKNRTLSGPLTEFPTQRPRNLYVQQTYLWTTFQKSMYFKSKQSR